MKEGFQIAAAQVPSRRGDVTANLQAHLAACAVAAQHRVSVLVFPELSLTGYEPDLAASHALTLADARLQPLADAAMSGRMTIVAGAPVASDSPRPWLASLVFHPDGARQCYAKRHLGGAEPDWFCPGQSPLLLSVDAERIGLAICADSSRASHPQDYAAAGATIYASSVFLTDEWYRTDVPRLESAARTLQLLVVMSNHGVSTGTLQSVGQSTIWGPDGAILARAHGTESCLVAARHTDQSWTAECIPV